MVGNDGKRPTWLQPGTKRRQGPLETGQLIVDGDSKALEEAGKVRWTRSWAQRSPDGADQIVACLERPCASPSDNLARQPACMALVGVVAENAREIGFVGAVQETPGVENGITHPHVERRTFTKGESARHRVDLMRRDAKVQENSVESDIAQGCDLVERGKVSGDRTETSGRFMVREPGTGGCQCLGISIEPHYRRAVLQQRLRVATATERSVEHAACVREGSHDFLYKYGRMVR